MAGQRHAQKFEGSVSDHKIVQAKIFKIMTQPELGKKITELRKAKGLTQEELVERCNISVRTIQRIEAGEVTPRSYTIRTILDVLGYSINDIEYVDDTRKKGFLHWISQQLLINVDFQEPSRLLIQQLNLAWIFGIVYFILGFFESTADFIRYTENRLIYHPATYISLKIVSLMAFMFFQRGFVVAGGLLKNYLLSVSSIIIIFGVLLTTSLDIASIYNEEIYSESTLGAMGITFGVLGIIFGIALIRLRKETGDLALATGVFQILAGFFFMTLVLSFVGFIILIPAELCAIILLFKIVRLTITRIHEMESRRVELSGDQVL